MATKSSPNLIVRFTGRRGKDRLIEALQEQQLVGGDVRIARKFANQANCQSWDENEVIVEQGGTDNDLYFILSGTVKIFVQEREVATRGVGQHFGEMALIDRTAVRSATVRAAEHTVVAKLEEGKFARIANTHPVIWRRLAVALAKRLKERNKFHKAPRSQPSVFIGSSSEGLEIAETINQHLVRFPIVPKLWTDGVFECSETTIESLIQETEQTDFAVLVLTSDDVVRSRGASKPSPRDNVIFELGLFMGSLKRKRTFIVAPKNTKLKIPTDLLGVALLMFPLKRGKALKQNMKSTLKSLSDLIMQRGPI